MNNTDLLIGGGGHPLSSRIDKLKRYLVTGSLLFHLGKGISYIGKSIVGLFQKARKKLDFAIGFAARRVVYSRGEICPNKIFVMTYDNAYSCNPRYIIEEVIRRELPVEIVWVKAAKKKPKGFPPEVKLVNRGSYSMFQEMASSKIWIDNASNYGDMQELLPAVDAGMTDYSSWAYDFVLTRRPLFLYVPDAEKYNNERGFFYPLESTPFPIATDNDELEKTILNFDEDQYIADVDQFLDDKGCYDDGKAAARAADLIEEILGLAGSDSENWSGALEKMEGYGE